jgi:formylglycine-generating enzyme required for sulfatase activity
MPDTKHQLKVFLCHAHHDKAKTRELYRYLRKRGVQPWLDAEDLVGGQNWREEIPKAIKRSDAIIVCLSKNSINKEGFVQAEITFALEKLEEIPPGRIFLIPVRFEECEVPFTLESFHYVDLFEEDGFSKLMKSLKIRASQLERTAVQVPQPDESNPNLNSTAEEKDEVELAEIIKPQSTEHETIEKASREKEEKDVTEKIEEPKSVATKQKPSLKTIAAIVSMIVIFAAIFGLPWKQWFATAPDITVTPINTAPITSLPTEITDLTGATMRLVPAGDFTMGSENGAVDEKPVHTVYLDAFYMDKYEVTNALYKACVDVGGCTPPQQTSSYTRSSYYGNSEFDDYPVIYVGWNQAKTYCKWRGASLPTEAQWEKAARGADARVYPWGNAFDGTKANFCDKNCPFIYADKTIDDNFADTAPIGSYESEKSPYGVYDLAGNILEWTTDWYSDTYYKNSSPSNPIGPTSGLYRVLRGGSWSKSVKTMRASARFFGKPDPIYYSIGFRCVRSP